MSKPSKQGQINADKKRALVQIRLNNGQTELMLKMFGNITAANKYAKEWFLKELERSI